MRTFLKTLIPVVALLGWMALPAFAEPGAGEDDISAKIQKQMEKIIELMEKNEQALLALSTGEKSRPGAVEVKPPALPPENGAKDPPPGSSGESGTDASKQLDEIIKAQRKMAGAIPGELEELVRMVPQ